MQKSDEQFLKEKDFWISLLLDRPLSVPIIRLMQKLNVRIHPNVISLLSLPFVLSAGFMFFNSELMIGAICYYVYFILDGVDGKWARLTGQRSKLGEQLDAYISVVGGLAMYFGLWHSRYYCRSFVVLGGLVILGHYVVVGLCAMFLREQFYDTGISEVGSFYTPEEEAFFTFFAAALFGVVFMAIPLLVSLQALSFVVLFFRQKDKPSVEEITKNAQKRIFKSGL